MRRPWLVVAALPFLASGPSAGAHTLNDLEAQLLKKEAYVEITDRAAPDFALVDPEGRAVRLADYGGKVVVLWFVYANCPDVCPLHSDLLAEIQAEVNRTPMRDLVEFVSITTDPARDTPEDLKAYGPLHGLDPANWTFLTSGPEREAVTPALAEQYGLAFTRIDDEYQAHGVVTHLIDREGKLRARYHGLNFQPANFIVHVNALTNDADHHGRASDEPSAWQKLLEPLQRLIGRP